MSVTGIEVEGVAVPEEGLKKIVVGEVKNVFLIQTLTTYQFAK